MMAEREGVHCASMFMLVRRSPSLASWSMRGVGAPRSGMFYDLPVCQEWIREREIARASRSRI